MKKSGKIYFLLFVIFTLAVSLFPAAPTKAATLSVSEAIRTQNGSTQELEGYIVGKPISASSVQTSSFSDDYALALADNPTEKNAGSMLYVQIPSSFRASYGLKSNPNLIGTKIIVTGSTSAYFSHPGLKNVTAMSKSTEGSTPVPNEPEEDSEQAPPSGNYEGYYNSASGKTGSSLKTALHEIIDDHTKLSYSAVWDALRHTDEDPNNRNNVILLYTGRSQNKTSIGGGVDQWNREHVWAKSHGDFGTSMGAGTDLHHLRPTDVSVNSARGNKDFDDGGTAQKEAPDTFADSDSWEPRDEVKGNIARMIFYMAVRYEGDSGELDLEVSEKVSNGSAPLHGKLSTLKRWNELDPVDDFERNRNEVIFTDYQHNRNPFIDHPEWVEAIW